MSITKGNNENQEVRSLVGTEHYRDVVATSY